MILKRFIKSWKAITILVLMCVISFLLLIVDTQVRTQMQVFAENDQLKSYKTNIDEWKKCFEGKNLYTIENAQYIKLSEVQECSNE